MSVSTKAIVIVVLISFTPWVAFFSVYATGKIVEKLDSDAKIARFGAV